MRSLPPRLRVPFNTLILVSLYHYVLVCYGQRYVNIALLKTCWQSSTYDPYIYDASKAVDNKTDTFSHTQNGFREWWEVDLGRNYQIKDIRIYPNPKIYSRVANTTITVDSRVCARVPQNDAAVVRVSCRNLMNGRRVRITKDDNASERYLSIAEFQILGCQQGYYGDTCNQNCLSSNCLKDECDRLSGQCIACNRNYKAPECIACPDGRYGQDCAGRCGNCLQGTTCNALTGHCVRCSPGFVTPFCNKPCDHGKYGEDCKYDCGSCANSQDCDKINGSCLKCVPGKKPPYCQLACDRGKYGDDCMYDCGSCANSQDCDKINGSCLKCVPGKKLPDCKSACDPGKYGEDCKNVCGSCADSQDCDKINGSCLKCVPGKKLPDCKSTCTNGTYVSDCVKACHCKDGQPCNVITGECSDGCTPGWTGKTCDQNCESGKYGQDCLQECGHCAGNAACKVTTGHCPSCTPGKNPPLCKEACKNGTYGGDCSKTCGHCKDGQPCNVITGECIDGCTGGWTSKTCDQSLVSFDVVIISGAIIGGFLILAISISVPLWLKRSKHRSVEESNRKQVQLQTSFNRRHLQAQTQLPNLLETGVDYDDVGNPYDTLDISVLDDGVKYTQPVFTKINTSTVNDTTN